MVKINKSLAGNPTLYLAILELTLLVGSLSTLGLKKSTSLDFMLLFDLFALGIIAYLFTQGKSGSLKTILLVLAFFGTALSTVLIFDSVLEHYLMYEERLVQYNGHDPFSVHIENVYTWWLISFFFANAALVFLALVFSINAKGNALEYNSKAHLALVVISCVSIVAGFLILIRLHKVLYLFPFLFVALVSIAPVFGIRHKFGVRTAFTIAYSVSLIALVLYAFKHWLHPLARADLSYFSDGMDRGIYYYTFFFFLMLSLALGLVILVWVLISFCLDERRKTKALDS